MAGFSYPSDECRGESISSGVAVDAGTIRMPADVSEMEVLGEVGRLNADPSVDGMLVLLPPSGQVRPKAEIEAIDPAKGMAGLAPISAGGA